MKKDFIVSKIEVPQDGSQYVFIALTDPNEPKSSVGGSGNSYPSPFGKSGEAIPFTSPEDLMKNLPKIMSNMLGAGGGMPGNSPTFEITMKEYEDMAIKVGDKVEIEINKVDANGT
ncbi:MAG TPA: hypothetical protein VE548_05660 [Nitrososphaeraceae archaeon]|jgi:hypothetical protein|nr:hypothetical protein [Nitrososphaeraceae archaeon]